MKALCKLLLVALALAALGGCAGTPIPNPFKGMLQSKGEPGLAAGIQNYENGNYDEAAKGLQNALDLGLDRSDQVKAHKYLAFIHCASGREKQCRDEFKKALDLDPSLELKPAEAGHPIWGPVFRSVKLHH
ncbi:MAG: TssQ family T6SS-associated lipoprotein [Burkholderiales bacterium]